MVCCSDITIILHQNEAILSGLLITSQWHWLPKKKKKIRMMKVLERNSPLIFLPSRGNKIGKPH